MMITFLLDRLTDTTQTLITKVTDKDKELEIKPVHRNHLNIKEENNKQILLCNTNRDISPRLS